MTAQAPAQVTSVALDEAFEWAVRLGSGTATPADEAAFARWLGRSAEHQRAWERVRTVDAEFAAVVDEAELSRELLERVGRSRRRFRSVAGLLLALAVTALLNGMPGWGHGAADYVTGTAEPRSVSIPGGSRVVLAGGSALDVDRVDNRPRLTLRGGAIWVDSSAAAPEAKPRVVTRQGEFTPLGTRFSLRQGRDFTELAVVHGRVRVDPAASGQGRIAAAGSRWRVTGGEARALAGDGLRPGAWRHGRVEARDARLGDLLRRLSAGAPGVLLYSDAVADLRVSGSYRLDRLDLALAALEQSLPVRVRGVPGWWVWIGAAD